MRRINEVSTENVFFVALAVARRLAGLTAQVWSQARSCICVECSRSARKEAGKEKEQFPSHWFWVVQSARFNALAN